MAPLINASLAVADKFVEHDADLWRRFHDALGEDLERIDPITSQDQAEAVLAGAYLVVAQTLKGVDPTVAAAIVTDYITRRFNIPS
jgi:hypothetical protein